MTDHSKNKTTLIPMSKIVRDLRLLTVDIRRTLTEEERLLKQVTSCGENTWATLRSCNRSRSRCPPLYIYFHVEKDHRERSRKLQNHFSSVSMAYNTMDAVVKALPEELVDDNGYSTQTFNGSQEEGADDNTLSFAEYSDMEPSLKISCIRYLLSHQTQNVAFHEYDCDESSV
jgi:hypothetical protein